MIHLPNQVEISRLKNRVDIVRDKAFTELRQPEHYGYLPDIYDSLCHMSRLLEVNEEYIDLREIDSYAKGAGALTVRDDGMPFSDSELGLLILSLTGPLHIMLDNENALSMINNIIVSQHALPVAIEIRDILLAIRDSFDPDGSVYQEYVFEMHDKLRKIRKEYGEALGEEYQRIFREVMG